jgi:hypothetical protein
MRRRHFLARLGTTLGSGLTACSAHAEGRASAADRTLCQDGSRVLEPQREVTVTHRADVVVVGATTGGLGGCMAAIAAARRGARTLLLETAGHLDLHVPIGLGVVIGIKGWLPTIREGLFREFAERVARAGAFTGQPLSPAELLEQGGLIVRHHEVVTTALLEMLVEAGVTLLFHTKLAAAAVEQGHIRAVVVESPRGRHAITGKAFVDSTGLADLAALAGAPLLREEAFMGLQAYIGGVDEARYRRWLEANAAPLDGSYRAWLAKEVGPFEGLKYPWDQWWPEFLGDRMPPALVRVIRQAHARKELTLIRRRGRDGVLAIPEGLKTNPGVARPRTYITGIDPLDVDDLNWAEVQSRLSLLELYRFLRKDVPGFEQATLERFGDGIGLRGGRYLDSKFPISKRDLDAGAKHADCIYLHRSGEKANIYEVPYRALLPQRVRNLLAVGKTTAAGVHLRQAHGVLFQGQAAGIAAALAAASSSSTADVDVKQVQKALRAAGVSIPG